MTLERATVLSIERDLKAAERFYVNVHGSKFSNSGTPDIMTCDVNGRLLGIEAKRSGGVPSVNQLRRGIEIIRSGGRFVVAYEDFDLDEVDSEDCELLQLDPNPYTLHTQIELFTSNKTVEVELV